MGYPQLAEKLWKRNGFWMATNTWPDLKRRLEARLDPVDYATWFAPLKLESVSAERMVLRAPNQHFVHTLEETYRPMINATVAELAADGLEVCFAVAEPERRPVERSGTKPSFELDSRYRFDNFVIGNSNQFAHAASQSVANRPSRSYNPLFLYGGVGLGKTHLMHAIGHQIREDHPDLRILYLPAEQFVNELINSIRFDRMPDFREHYRTIDVLLIDDIQFIANKERTQEEFFHTFNKLYTGQKQIILSSDAPPRSIPALEDRLRSRFGWGLIADIQPPELETKIAILRRKAEQMQEELPDEVAHFIAHRVKSNVRELEMMLNRVLAFSSFTGEAVSLALAKETLRDILVPEDQRVTSAEIIKFVARYYGLKVSEIKSRTNSKHIAFPRQVAMFLCKRLTTMSFPEIGKQFNDKHHSTVMYSVDKIERLRADDSELARAVQSFLDHFS